jgi:hypothetical protein
MVDAFEILETGEWGLTGQFIYRRALTFNQRATFPRPNFTL